MTLRRMRGEDGKPVEIARCNGHGCEEWSELPVKKPWLTLTYPGDDGVTPIAQHFHDGACLGIMMAFQAITTAQATTTDPQRATYLDRVATALFDLQPGVQRIVVESPDVEGVNYLIWSNKHQKWWMPVNRGYTTELAEAGAYTADEAAFIALTAAHGGLRSRGVVLVSDYRSAPDFMIALGEDLKKEDAL